MNVASIERCRELHGLSGWETDDICISSSCDHHGYYERGTYICPKYNLGYLLRKLPTLLNSGDNPEYRGDVVTLRHFRPVGQKIRQWECFYDIYKSGHWAVANTPEDAACELAIELFKRDILKREDAV